MALAAKSPSRSAIRRCCIWKRPIELDVVGNATANLAALLQQFTRHSETMERESPKRYAGNKEQYREHATTFSYTVAVHAQHQLLLNAESTNASANSAPGGRWSKWHANDSGAIELKKPSGDDFSSDSSVNDSLAPGISHSHPRSSRLRRSKAISERHPRSRIDWPASCTS